MGSVIHLLMMHSIVTGGPFVFPDECARPRAGRIMSPIPLFPVRAVASRNGQKLLATASVLAAAATKNPVNLLENVVNWLDVTPALKVSHCP